jgi:hypothetical protein
MDSNTVPRTNKAAKMCVGKEQYVSEEVALTMALRRMRSKHNPPAFLRPYRCSICNYYHLTHKEK